MWFYASLVSGVDQTGEFWGISFASGERRPCCLLPQLWRGKPPAAGHWGSGQGWHQFARCMDLGCHLWGVEGGKWYQLLESVVYVRWALTICEGVLSNWLCQSVCLSVCHSSEKFWDLNYRRVKGFFKPDSSVESVYLIGNKPFLPSTFPAVSYLTSGLSTISIWSILDSAESTYMRTQHVSTNTLDTV